MATYSRTWRSFRWNTGQILRSRLLARKQASIPRNPSQRAVSATFASLRRTFPSGKSRNRVPPRLLSEAAVPSVSSLARSFSIRRSHSRASLRARFGAWVTAGLPSPGSKQPTVQGSPKSRVG